MVGGFSPTVLASAGKAQSPPVNGVGGPTRLFRIIGLDAADVGRLLRLQYLHQLQEAHLELGGNLVSQRERKVDPS